MDDKLAPLFGWSKEYTDEYKHFKLTGICPKCGEVHLSGKTVRIIKSDGTEWKPSSLVGRLERDTYLECTKCNYRFPICIPRKNETASEIIVSAPDAVEVPTSFSDNSLSKPSAIKSALSISDNKPTVEIEWSKQEKEVQVATEVIQVPLGVKITVKRSRTVDHTVTINWRTQSDTTVDVGIKQIISATIHGEIEKSRGRTYHESEKMEYEIELNGEKHNRYKLIWSDIWLTGNSQVTQGDTKMKYSFEFRERSELSVVAIEE